MAGGELVEKILQLIVPMNVESNEYARHLLAFCGTARDFIVALSGSDSSVKGIDAAAAKLNETQRTIYDAARQEFTKQYAEMPEAQRESIRRFYAFDFDIVRNYMLDELK